MMDAGPRVVTEVGDGPGEMLPLLAGTGMLPGADWWAARCSDEGVVAPAVGEAPAVWGGLADCVLRRHRSPICCLA